MAKGFKHGAGGSNPLNFKVIGSTTAPSNPKENMIWVNTDQKITNWHFGVEEPDSWAFVENAGTVLGSLHGRTYVKKNSGRAVYAFCKTDFSGPIIVSTDPNAVVTSFEGYENNTFTGTVTVDGIVYYYNSFGGFAGASVDQITPSFKMYDSNHNHAMRLAKLLATNKSTEETVWILTSASSPVAFNALKKNGIQVYPISAKQYVGGAWVEKTAKSYQGGVWVDWIPEGALYHRGNELTAKTGGWSEAAWLPTSHYTNSGLTFNKNVDRMSLGFSVSSVTAGRDWCITSNNQIDMSKCNTLIIEAESSWDECEVGLSSVKPSSDATKTWVASTKLSTSGKTTTLDVSGCNSSYYVVVWLFAPKEQTTANIDVYEILTE